MKPERPGLSELLWREGYRFEFFQAVRLLQRLYPERSPVGLHDLPENEAVRFKTHVSMGFPASEIYEISPPASMSVAAGSDGHAASAPIVWTAFMGLAGAQGVLPNHYTQLLSDPSARQQTAALREFLDIFNHRLIALFYRAWEKYRFPVAYERGQDRMSGYLLSLVGMGTAGLQSKLGVSDQILLYYSGILSQRPRAAVGLEGLLQDYFGVPVTVEQFTGEWFLMNADALTTLGGLGQNNQLGVSAVLWERVFDPQARFRVKFGPLTLSQFEDFLPGRDGYQHATELTRFYVGEELSFEIQPILRAADVPACALGVNPSMRLGWAMWLKTEPFEADTTQPVFAARTAMPLGDSCG